MALTLLQMRYVGRDDRALLRIESVDEDVYELWLTRAVTLALLARARELRVLSPDRIAAMERNARHPVRVLALSMDPRSLKLPPRTSTPGQQPLLVETVELWLSDDGVSCTLMQAGVFSLRFELPWDFFSHWILMLENMDEEADWGLSDALPMGSIAHSQAIGLAPASSPRALVAAR